MHVELKIEFITHRFLSIFLKELNHFRKGYLKFQYVQKKLYVLLNLVTFGTQNELKM